MTLRRAGFLGCVSDSYDIYKCVDQIWGRELRGQVLDRGTAGGRIIIRPDSGEPLTVILKVSNSRGVHTHTKGQYSRSVHTHTKG